MPGLSQIPQVADDDGERGEGRRLSSWLPSATVSTRRQGLMGSAMIPHHVHADFQSLALAIGPVKSLFAHPDVSVRPRIPTALLAAPLRSAASRAKPTVMYIEARKKLVDWLRLLTRQQVRRLYARDLAVFPPPGLSHDDTCFARTDRERPCSARRRRPAAAVPRDRRGPGHAAGVLQRTDRSRL